MASTIGSSDGESALKASGEGSFGDALNECREIAAKADDIADEFVNLVIRVRKAVQSEIKWGGLIFNPEDIGKKLRRLNEFLQAVTEDGEPLSMGARILTLSSYLASCDLVPAERRELELAIRDALDSLEAANAQFGTIPNWIDTFFRALCMTTTARALLPLLPAYAFDDEIETRYSSPRKGLLNGLFGA